MFLEIKDLNVGYSGRAVVTQVSIEVEKNETVVLLGHNGAGKTTTLKGAFGLLKPLAGTVRFDGCDITGRPPRSAVKQGVVFLPQENYVFEPLSVQENLELSTYCVGRDGDHDLQGIYDLFPILKARAQQRAGTLSGGERRMLGLGMSLMMRPRLLLLDEPTLGLSPLMVEALKKAIQRIQETREITIFMVEQNIRLALELGRRAYVMKVGTIILEESTSVLLKRGRFWDLF